MVPPADATLATPEQHSNHAPAPAGAFFISGRRVHHRRRITGRVHRIPLHILGRAPIPADCVRTDRIPARPARILIRVRCATAPITTTAGVSPCTAITATPNDASYSRRTR